jgi:ectoine hydroxylase-related dioxygenase (phytanoyl-CoA dioxygenase family)
MTDSRIPSESYGILQQDPLELDFDEVVEQVRNLGYAILDSGYSVTELEGFETAFEQTRKRYLDTHGEARLRSISEYHTIRSPLTHGDRAFLDLALNENLLSILRQLIAGKFVLNQQNGLINPPRENGTQGAWHRDLPYQHFVSSRPLAINALFCVDDFTVENGATFVLPESHKSEAFPNAQYIEENALQIEAKAGSFIVLDCMLFHAGGYNQTVAERRAVNNVFNIPYFKQQINIPGNMESSNLSDTEKEIMGFGFQEPGSIEDYFSTRVSGPVGAAE